jgi:cytochrome P450
MEGEDLNYDDLRSENVPFLEAVVLEILRISQVALFVSRMTTCETQILGHFIPKGTEIVLHIGHAGLQNSKPGEGDGNKQRPSHRPGVPKPLWHGDAESFNPDRWLDERGSFCPNAGMALPFGAGHRKCYGYKLAVSCIRIR